MINYIHIKQWLWLRIHAIILVYSLLVEGAPVVYKYDQ